MEERADIICINDVEKKKTVNRYVTMVGSLPFYRSSGNNSGVEGTWFPFAGFQEEAIATIPKGRFLKPTTNIEDNLTEYFPEDIATHLREHVFVTIKDIITRFGNFESMCISLLIGGGFWADEEGKELEKMIRQSHTAYLDKIENQYGEAIQRIQGLDENAGIQTYSNPKTANQWLSKQGSRFIRDKDNNIISDFSLHSKYEELTDEIDEHIKQVTKDSKSSYRVTSKGEKLLVLAAAKEYLEGKISRSDFEATIAQNKHYSDAFLKSTTEKLINKVLIAKPKEYDELIQNEKEITKAEV